MVGRQFKLKGSVFFFIYLVNCSMAIMTSRDGHASSAGLETCLRCKKVVKGIKAGICVTIGFTQNVRVLEQRCTGHSRSLRKFAVKAGKTHSAIKWYCDKCTRTFF